MPNNKVVLELNIERRTKQNGESSTMSVRLILTISEDGQEISIERNGVLQNFNYDDDNYGFDNLPECYGGDNGYVGMGCSDG